MFLPLQNICLTRVKERDLTWSYDEAPIPTTILTTQIQQQFDNTTTPPKLRLLNDCGSTKDRQLE